MIILIEAHDDGQDYKDNNMGEDFFLIRKYCLFEDVSEEECLKLDLQGTSKNLKRRNIFILRH